MSLVVPGSGVMVQRGFLGRGGSGLMVHHWEEKGKTSNFQKISKLLIIYSTKLSFLFPNCPYLNYLPHQPCTCPVKTGCG